MINELLIVKTENNKIRFIHFEREVESGMSQINNIVEIDLNKNYGIRQWVKWFSDEEQFEFSVVKGLNEMTEEVYNFDNMTTEKKIKKIISKLRK